MIRYATGDATQVPADAPPTIIAHVCNDIGAWGGGFTGGLSRVYPQAERDYRRWHAHNAAQGMSLLGRVQVVKVAPHVTIANMVAQHGLRGRGNPVPLQYDHLQDCLKRLATHALSTGAHVQMPRIGAGLARGHWPTIESHITEHLVNRGVPVTVLDLPQQP